MFLSWSSLGRMSIPVLCPHQPGLVHMSFPAARTRARVQAVMKSTSRNTLNQSKGNYRPLPKRRGGDSYQTGRGNIFMRRWNEESKGPYTHQSTFNRKGDQGPEKLSNLPKITKLANGKGEIWTQGCLKQNWPYALNCYPHYLQHWAFYLYSYKR
jgi:hypothetical protein